MYYANLYLPDFPAWAFRRHEPIEGPLVVVEGGRVVAADAALRRLGVDPGVTAERVQALVPDVVVRLREVVFEKVVWEEVLQTVNRYTPFLESTRPGFAFFRPPDAIVDVRALATDLQGQVGMGPNRSIALLASLKPAPGTVLLVEQRYVSSFLDRYPLERLMALDFEETLIEQMALFGYRTLGKAAALSHHHLTAQFGTEGGRLYTLLHPKEPEEPVPLYRPAPSLTTIYEFDLPVSEPADLLPALEYLIERAAARLGDQRCRRIKVSLQCAATAGNRFACRVLPEPLGRPHRLMHVARTLLMGMLKYALQVETLTLELSALCGPAAEQGSLFSRRPAVGRAVEAVNRRFPGAMKQAVVQPDAVFPEDRVTLKTKGNGE